MKRVMMAARTLVGLMLFGASGTLLADSGTWTGDSGNGRWTDSGNWNGASYPQTADDVATFDKDATVTVDAGAATDISYLQVTAGATTLKATDGSSLRVNKASPAYETGIVVNNGATLVQEVPMTAASGIAISKWYDGLYVLRSSLTSVLDSNGVGLSIGVGTNIVEGTGSMSNLKSITVLGNSSPATVPAYLILKDSAALNLKRLYLKMSGNSQEAHLEQLGASTAVNASYDVQIGYVAGSKAPVSYKICDGTLTTRFLMVGGESDGLFVQEGGSTKVTEKLTVGTAGKGHGRIDLKGGQFETLLFSMPNGTFNFSGGSLSFTDSGTVELPSSINVSGSPEFTTANAAKALRIGADIDLKAVTNLTVSGAGTIRFAGKRSIPDVLTVDGGHLLMESGAAFKPTVGATQATKLCVKNGGTFKISDITSRVMAPVDIELSSGGKIVFPVNENGVLTVRSAIVAHSLILDGVVQAKGRYQGVRSGAYLDGYAGSSIVIPYVWTGAGDGTSWTDAKNWEGDAVPPNEQTTPVDLSRAAGRTVVLSGETKVTCVVFQPTGIDRAVTIGGEGSLIVDAPTADNAAFVVSEDAEIVVDVDLVRPADGSGQEMSFVGGGRLTVRKSYPSNTLSNVNRTDSLCPAFVFDGALVFSGPDARISIWSPTRYNNNFFSAQALEKEGPSKVVFSSDCSISLTRMLLPVANKPSVREIVQEGGSMTTSDIYISNVSPYDDGGSTYTLAGGTLNPEYIYLGAFYLGSYARRPGGSFRMTGGTLTARKITSEQNQNYFYLEGGELHIYSLGLQPTYTSTGFADGGYVPNTEPCVQLGGATITTWTSPSATCNLPARLTGVGGDTVFYSRFYPFIFGTDVEVDGPGGFVKTGSESLVFNGKASFTGAARVEAGKVTFSETSEVSGLSRIVVTGGSVEMLGTVTAKPDYVQLANESSLILAEGVNLKVGRLFVGGAERTGSVQFGEGTVTVEPPTAGAVWCGTTEGAWNTAANWKGEAVPTASDVANLSFADGQTIVLDGADGAAAGLVCTTPGTVTVSGAAALDLPANAPVTLAEGVTLVLDVPLSLAGKICKYGKGTLVLKKDVSATDAANVVVVGGKVDVQGGTVAATVNPAWTDGSERVDALAEQNGGAVTMTGAFARPNGGNAFYILKSGALTGAVVQGVADDSTGSFAFVQDGGTATFDGFGLAHSTYTLNGGTLRLNGAFSGMTVDSAIELNGGRIESGFDGDVFPKSPVRLGGAVTIATTEGATANIPCELRGEGSIVHAGAGTLTFSEPLIGVGELLTQGGEMRIEQLVTATNLAVTAGTLTLAGPEDMFDRKALITVGSESALNLDFDGVMTVYRLTVNGKSKAAGDYGVPVGKTLGGLISGRGVLRVEHGEPPGVLLIVR